MTAVLRVNSGTKRTIRKKMTVRSDAIQSNPFVIFFFIHRYIGRRTIENAIPKIITERNGKNIAIANIITTPSKAKKKLRSIVFVFICLIIARRERLGFICKLFIFIREKMFYSHLNHVSNLTYSCCY